MPTVNKMISSLIEKIGINKVAHHLNCCERSVYRLEKGEAELKANQLLIVMKQLKSHDIDIYKLINKSYLDKLTQSGLGFVYTRDFDSKGEFYAHIERFETDNSRRMTVISRFPSDIYLTEPRTHVEKKRVEKIKNGVIGSMEFYPLSSVINFGFTPTSRLSCTEKISILNRFNDYFNTAKSNRLFLFDDDAYQLPVHSEFEILKKENLLIIDLPSAKKNYLFFRSPEIVNRLHQYFNVEMEISLSDSDAHTILDLLKESLKNGDDTDALINFYHICNRERAKFGKIIFKQLNPSLKTKIKAAKK